MQPPRQEEVNNELEWQSIQQKLDAEYQKKLKEVNDEAMKKLASYRQEHKQLTERAQTMYRSASRA